MSKALRSSTVKKCFTFTVLSLASMLVLVVFLVNLRVL